MPEKQNYNILYVDDDEQNLFIFHRVLDKSYNVITSTTATEALEVLKKTPIHVLLADQRMPDLNGVQLLNRVMQQYPETIRILVTGYSDIDVVINAINKGCVYRYISKPWDNEDIITTVQNALELYTLRQKNNNLMAELDRKNRRLEQKVLELDFLNDIQLELKELTDWDDIIKTLFTRIKNKLGAVSGCYGTFNINRTPLANLYLCDGKYIDEFSALIARLDRDAKINEPQIIPNNDGENTIFLPLDFQKQNFGYLTFRLHGTPVNIGISFLRAVSYVGASALYSFYSHKDIMEKERFFIIGQMASMIVHDLKGPINTIMGFASVLSNDLSEEQREEYTNTMKEELSRLSDTVEELLDFSRGKKHLSLQYIDLKSYLPGILKIFGFSLQAASIKLDVKIKTNGKLCADPQKLKKVFINLINNAIELLSNYNGKREITITAYETGNATVIQQENTGPKIPQTIIQKLFDPFFSYKKKSGTGLGLTICKKIVEEHDGAISVTSEPGNTVFTITIPHKTIS
ncbi:MAG: hybrid sensor histidine kinase/response regulator [Spirochaetes bacterium]|nr:hybrid sensor histidine kinase/response regulator [Spirochaetota bacterium]